MKIIKNRIKKHLWVSFSYPQVNKCRIRFLLLLLKKEYNLERVPIFFADR